MVKEPIAKQKQHKELLGNANGKGRGRIKSFDWPLSYDFHFTIMQYTKEFNCGLAEMRTGPAWKGSEVVHKQDEQSFYQYLNWCKLNF